MDDILQILELDLKLERIGKSLKVRIKVVYKFVIIAVSLLFYSCSTVFYNSTVCKLKYVFVKKDREYFSLRKEDSIMYIDSERKKSKNLLTKKECVFEKSKMIFSNTREIRVKEMTFKNFNHRKKYYWKNNSSFLNYYETVKYNNDNKKDSIVEKVWILNDSLIGYRRKVYSDSVKHPKWEYILGDKTTKKLVKKCHNCD